MASRRAHTAREPSKNAANGSTRRDGSMTYFAAVARLTVERVEPKIHSCLGPRHVTISRRLASHETGLPLQQILGDPPHRGPAFTQPGKEKVPALDPFRHLLVRPCHLPVKRINVQEYPMLLKDVNAESAPAVRRPDHRDIGLEAGRRAVILGGAAVEIWTRMKLTTDKLPGLGHIAFGHPQSSRNRCGRPARQWLKMISNDRPGQRMGNPVGAPAIDLDQQAVPKVTGAYPRRCCLAQGRDDALGLRRVCARHTGQLRNFFGQVSMIIQARHYHCGDVGLTSRQCQPEISKQSISPRNAGDRSGTGRWITRVARPSDAEPDGLLAAVGTRPVAGQAAPAAGIRLLLDQRRVLGEFARHRLL